ncbi:5-dehydro-2-deoxygluconokinase [Aestuariivirga litoralis]|uniref:5-dehydro-2-deoxygluconokinase n=1 Tax=Aestuariivirga litoralis TaxID=2650924 RepID=UPI001FEE1166|nr:5-dehydro-2-deoxygluconokinase [Aestuariivirga litoralis]MBG1230714.1 5-dehydro-2-deoxygluconokinase [Aestuariivirga litoralis]
MLECLAQNKFLVIGRAGMDLYADPPGTEIEDALKFSAALGGSAANIAVAISKQGGNTALLTAVSNDAVGRYTLKALTSYGVDTRFIKQVGGEARNSLAVVETRAVHCQSVIYRNGAADFEVTKADAAAINYSEFAALIVTGTALAREPSRSATLEAMTLADKAGLVLIIDIDYRPYSWSSKEDARDICRAAAELCDIIIGNDEEFAVLNGADDGRDLAQQMATKTSRIVVYKMGEKGAITFSGGTDFATPVFSVSALKPTGAGDGFMGGFISGLVAGDPLPQAVKRGAATAALVVTRVGCAPAMPDTAEVLSFISQRSA